MEKDTPPTLPPREPVGELRKKSKAYGKHTETWKIFEALFLDLSEDKLPWRQKMTKGQAINLAIGLNRCQLAWARENGVPDEALTRSAKAREGAEGWELEVSRNYYRTGELSPSALARTKSCLTGMSAGILASLQASGDIGPRPVGELPNTEGAASPSSMEAFLASSGFAGEGEEK